MGMWCRTGGGGSGAGNGLAQNGANQGEGGNPGGQKGKEPGSPPLDVSYIAADFHAALVVHPRRLLESRLASRAITPQQLNEVGQELGIAPRNVEQLIVVLDHARPDPAAPAKNQGPADGWVLVDSAEGRFSARFPQKPKAAERKTLLGVRHDFRAEVGKGEFEYDLGWFDFSPDFAGGTAELKLETAVRGLEFRTG